MHREPHIPRQRITKSRPIWQHTLRTFGWRCRQQQHRIWDQKNSLQRNTRWPVLWSYQGQSACSREPSIGCRLRGNRDPSVPSLGTRRRRPISRSRACDKGIHRRSWTPGCSKIDSKWWTRFSLWTFKLLLICFHCYSLVGDIWVIVQLIRLFACHFLPNLIRIEILGLWGTFSWISKYPQCHNISGALS